MVQQRLLTATVVGGTVVETLCWPLATIASGRDAWHHDLSHLAAVGSEYAWLVLVGEAGFTVAVLAMSVLVRRTRLRGDHAAVGTGLLFLAAVTLGVQAVAREGSSWEAAHGPAAVLGLLALVCAPLVLAVPVRAAGHPDLAAWSVSAFVTALALLAAGLAPGLVGGICERGLALVLCLWLALAAAALSRIGAA